MSDNIQAAATGQKPPCLRQKIGRTTYLIELHFNANSTQSVEDKLKRVILYDLEYGNRDRTENFDEK